MQKIRVAVSKKSCSQLTVPPIDIDLLGLEFVGGPLDVPSDGAVAWEHLVDLSLLRRARALAVVGDHDGDGDDDLGACGDLVMRRVAWTRDDERARGVFASAEQLGDAFAGGRLLAHAMVDPDGPDRLGAVFIDLAPSTQHRLALSPESCERLVGTDSGFEAPSRQLMTLMTDAQGTASVHAGGVNFGLGDGSVRSARSMVVGRPGADGPVLAACAPLRYGIVRGDPKP